MKCDWNNCHGIAEYSVMHLNSSTAKVKIVCNKHAKWHLKQSVERNWPIKLQPITQAP